MHRDRLVRVGVEYLDGGQGRRVMVVEGSESTDDVVCDMIEVVASMGARLYGRDGARHRALRAVAAAKQQPGSVGAGDKAGGAV